MSSLTSEFSPAQHARIRLHLVLIPAYICLVWGWTDLVSRLPVGPGSEVHRVRDFAANFYVAGLIANQGDRAALYDMDRRAAMLATIVPNAPNVRFPPFYGPQISVFFSPLARLPYEWALVVWMAITVVVYLGCGYAMWRACPQLRDRWDAVLVLLLADPTLFYTLSFTQISAIALVCVTGAFFALRAHRPFLAGVFIGCLIYKPSLGVAFGIVLICAAAMETHRLARPEPVDQPPRFALRRSAVASAKAEGRARSHQALVGWRIVLGAVTGGIGQIAIGALFWGPAILGDYVRAQIRLIPDMRDQFYIHHLHSWRGFFEILGLPNAVAQTAYAIAAVLILSVAVRCWRSAAPLQVRYALLLIATVLVNPHGYVYDSIILMPAFLLLWDWAEQQRKAFAMKFAWLIYLCYLSPLFAIVALVAHVQVSVPALTLLGLLAIRLTHRARPSEAAVRA